jgi:predicted TIM-barrel fold metal-dependent hydrolase
MIVDTHVHVVACDDVRYPPQPTGVGSQWFREVPMTVEQFADTASAAGVERAVLVQAYGAYGFDNTYVVDAASRYPGRFVSVGIVDAEDPGAPGTLRELAAVPSFAGVRLFTITDPPPIWLDDPRTFPLWEVASELDLRVVVTLLAPDLPHLRRVLAQFPDQPVVLDHCGFPDVAGGAPFASAAELFALASFDNLHLKVTSHLLETVASVPGGDARDLVDRLTETFGPRRLVWGSDYPQTHDRPYAALVELGLHACSRLSADDRALVMGGNALRLWPALAV